MYLSRACLMRSCWKNTLKSVYNIHKPQATFILFSSSRQLVFAPRQSRSSASPSLRFLQRVSRCWHGGSHQVCAPLFQNEEIDENGSQRGENQSKLGLGGNSPNFYPLAAPPCLRIHLQVSITEISSRA